MTIDCCGAQRLLDLLGAVKRGEAPGEGDFAECLALNAFFVDFYRHYAGITGSEMEIAIREAARTGDIGGNKVLNLLHGGFNEALPRLDELRSRIEGLESLDGREVEARVLACLPAGTDIACEVHFTVDAYNGGFQYGNGIGYSLLLERRSADDIGAAIMHELHHKGYAQWSAADEARRSAASGKSGRSIAVSFADNLLKEGLAIYFFNREEFVEGCPANARAGLEFRRRAAALKAGEAALFRDADRLLRQSLGEDPDLASCRQLFRDITTDSSGIQPAGHYLGLRMVETLMGSYAKDEILGCVKRLDRFLPMYNEAAGRMGAFRFDAGAVDAISSTLAGTEY